MISHDYVEQSFTILSYLFMKITLELWKNAT